MSPEDALRMLERLGANAWLVRHHELVVEAATQLCDRLARERIAFDRAEVLAGAALHDAGKIVHPEEMHGPGHAHEAAGRQLLVEHGVPERLARFCITHATWSTDDCTIEDLLVALADRLWKGKREDALEKCVLARIAKSSRRAHWDVMVRLDAIYEDIAASSSDRLARSQV